jgi:hypothetical protein
MLQRQIANYQYTVTYLSESWKFWNPRNTRQIKKRQRIGSYHKQRKRYSTDPSNFCAPPKVDSENQSQ